MLFRHDLSSRIRLKIAKSKRFQRKGCFCAHVPNKTYDIYYAEKGRTDTIRHPSSKVQREVTFDRRMLEPRVLPRMLSELVTSHVPCSYSHLPWSVELKQSWKMQVYYVLRKFFADRQHGKPNALAFIFRWITFSSAFQLDDGERMILEK